MKLHHRLPRPHITKQEHVHDLVKGDGLRHRVIAAKLRHHSADNASFAMVVNSGAYSHQGTYFVTLQIGTPEQQFILVPDTGSEITWMRCRYVQTGPDPWPGLRVFDAPTSESFKAIDCSSEMCQRRLPSAIPEKCPSPASPCQFSYSYVDDSWVEGIYANEWATVASLDGQKTKLQGLVIGCGTSYQGTFGVADGILGLGYNYETFAVHASEVYGGRFSYCLVDHLSPQNVSSYLTFGPNPALTAPRRTPLILDPVLVPYYGLAIEGISVGGEVLPIPMSVWDVKQGGGTIIDSGQTMTTLASPAYEMVVSAIHKHLVAVPRVNDSDLEYCYYWPGVQGPPPEVPQLVVHFAGGARLEPPVKSYLVDVSPVEKCLGFVRVEGPIWSTIGNILQQNHLWEFDLRNRQLRFQPDTCDRNH